MIPPTGNCYQVQCTTGATALTGGSCFLLACLRMLLLLSGDVELNPGPTTNKELNIKAVMGIFGTFAHHYKTIGDGLEVYIADVIQMQDTPKGKLREIFQRWFDAGKNVNWDTLKNLCDKNSAELGQAKNDIQAYLTSTSGSTSAAESMYREPHGRAAAGQDKELDMAAVMQIFGPSANHFGIIGAGLGVKVDDLMVTPGAADTNLILVFQRWFDADRDVNWKALEKLCDTYSDKLGKAKKKLPNYIGSALGPPAQSIETRPQASAQKKKIDLKEPLDSTAAGQDEAKSDEKESDRPPDVSKFCPILDIIQKKIKKKFFVQLTKEEKEFIKEVHLILVTATPIEYRAVMGATKPTGEDGNYIQVVTEDQSESFILGKFGPCNVAIIRTGQGPDKTEETLTSVQKAVDAKFVIALGICYGARENKTGELCDKTSLADIIVPEGISDTTGQYLDGKEVIVYANTYPCGKKLYNLFKHDEVFEIENKSVKVHHQGDLATEYTLFRSKEAKEKVLKYVQRALGGEMEAKGIHKAAERVGFEWIVIKAIVDWGTEEKDKAWQPFGAVLCAKFVLKCLKEQPCEGDPLKGR